MRFLQILRILAGLTLLTAIIIGAEWLINDVYSLNRVGIGVVILVALAAASMVYIMTGAKEDFRPAARMGAAGVLITVALLTPSGLSTGLFIEEAPPIPISSAQQ